MSDSDASVSPAVAWLAAAAAAIVAFVSWVPFALGCAIGENNAGTGWETLCDYLWLYWPGLAVAAGPSLWGVRLAHRGRLSGAWLACAFLVGLAVAAAPWVLFGDPAGNFGGVFNLDD